MALTGGEIAAVVAGSLLGILVLVLILLKLHAKLTCGVCTSKSSMKGKTVIVTGATSGIGLETARNLARRGARLILACRDTEAGYRLKDKLANETDNNFILVKKLDLSSEESVRAFAADVNSTEEKLDVLIHNAAVAFSFQKKVNDNGLDLTMATNYFGPFLLTHLLIDLLKKSKPSRVVVVGSGMYWIVRHFDEDKLNSSDWPPFYTYFYSKYAVMMFALELSKRLDVQGVTVNTLHPGVQYSGIWRNCPIYFRWFLISIKWLFKDDKQGAQTTIHCAVCEQVEGITGKYFFDCKVRQLPSEMEDSEKALKLWKQTGRLVLKPTDPCISITSTTQQLPV